MTPTVLLFGRQKKDAVGGFQCEDNAEIEFFYHRSLKFSLQKATNLLRFRLLIRTSKPLQDAAEKRNYYFHSFFLFWQVDPASLEWLVCMLHACPPRPRKRLSVRYTMVVELFFRGFEEVSI